MSRFFVCAAAALVFFVGAEIVKAQPRWLPVSSPGPTSRDSHAMVYDSARGKVVLFGGWNGGVALADTWEWDGTNWMLRFAPWPRARSAHAIAYDSVRGKTVLFGGYNESTVFADTWEWDGTNWIQRFVPGFLNGRYNHAMAYDSARGVTVLFGGMSETGPLADTWEWDGASWTRRTVSPFPSARSRHAMAYDSARGKVVLFGGSSGSNETWEWDGVNWTQRVPATNPPALSNHAMAYHSARGTTVLFGGGPPPTADTWEWDGTDWIRTSVTPSCAGWPLGRFGCAMAYHATPSGILLFGGSSGSTVLGDTWRYGDPPILSCLPIGQGHSGECFPIICATRPTIGTTFTLAFSNQGNPAGFNLLQIGERLDPPLGLGPPVLCAEGLIYPIPRGVIEALGNPAIFSIEIPNEPLLVGQSVTVQGASLEVTGCFRLTDGLQVTVQAP